ncbi:MAG: hypothetical protein RL616_2702, partial [Verrucomicrobiota bacterium]
MKPDYKTKLTRLFLFAGLLGSLILNANAADKSAETNSEVKPLIASPASWVKPQFFDRQTLGRRPEGSIEQHWLLLERQMNAATNE